MDKCTLCRSDKKDDALYGEFIRHGDVQVHVHCLYLTSNLCQNGDPNSKLLGFLPADIKSEAKRVQKLHCYYCTKTNANIGCCEVKCRRSFHLVCGINNGAQNQFADTYTSYCHQHIRTVLKHKKRPKVGDKCLICFESVKKNVQEKFDVVNTLLAPCCQNGWFHKACLQRFAAAAGYFFKCPLCNDQNTFRSRLPYMGIFIPNKDASWELEPNAFAELLERPTNCAAPRCQYQRGRRSGQGKKLLLCTYCGSIGVHVHCDPADKGRLQGHTFQCSTCCTNERNNNEQVQLQLEEDDAAETDVDVEAEEQAHVAEDTASMTAEENLRQVVQTTAAEAQNAQETSSDSEEAPIRPVRRKRAYALMASSSDDDDDDSEPIKIPRLERSKTRVIRSDDDIEDAAAENMEQHNNKQLEQVAAGGGWQLERDIFNSTSSSEALEEEIAEAAAEELEETAVEENVTDENAEAEHIEAGQHTEEEEEVEQDMVEEEEEEDVVADVTYEPDLADLDYEATAERHTFSKDSTAMVEDFHADVDEEDEEEERDLKYARTRTRTRTRTSTPRRRHYQTRSSAVSNCTPDAEPNATATKHMDYWCEKSRRSRCRSRERSRNEHRLREYEHRPRRRSNIHNPYECEDQWQDARAGYGRFESSGSETKTHYGDGDRNNNTAGSMGRKRQYFGNWRQPKYASNKNYYYSGDSKRHNNSANSSYASSHNNSPNISHSQQHRYIEHRNHYATPQNYRYTRSIRNRDMDTKCEYDLRHDNPPMIKVKTSPYKRFEDRRILRNNRYQRYPRY